MTAVIHFFAEGHYKDFMGLMIINIRPPNVGVGYSNQWKFLQHSEEPYNNIIYSSLYIFLYTVILRV